MGGIETCDVPDTSGLLLVPGHNTKSATAVVIHYMSSVKRPAGGWVTGWPKVKWMSCPRCSLQCYPVGLLAPGRTHNTSKNFARYDRAVRETTTCWLLRYTTSAKPTFRFEYVYMRIGNWRNSPANTSVTSY